jgi:tetratricopeptide (TPR) repeat protein
MRSGTSLPSKLADRYRRGLELYCRGRLREAVDQLSPLSEQPGLAGRLARYYEGLSHRSLGIEALREGRCDEAEKHFRAAGGRLGQSSDLSAYLCAVFVRTGRHETCADELQKVLDLKQGGPQTRQQLAQAQWRAGRREEAFLTLGAGLREWAENGPLLMQMGLLHAAEGRYEEAIKYLRSAVRADCGNAEAHRYLALGLAAMGKPHLAARSFQRAWELRPDDMMLPLQLSLAARAAGEQGTPLSIALQEARRDLPAESHIRHLAEYLQAEPDFVDCFLALPESSVDPMLFATLGHMLRTALDAHPTYADLHLRYSKVLERLERPDDACEHALRALEINPDYLDALLQLGGLRLREGRSQEAGEFFTQAIQRGADWPDVHCLAGEAMARCDMPIPAGAHFRRALELKTDYPRAEEALASLAA